MLGTRVTVGNARRLSIREKATLTLNPKPLPNLEHPPHPPISQATQAQYLRELPQLRHHGGGIRGHLTFFAAKREEGFRGAVQV